MLDLANNGKERAMAMAKRSTAAHRARIVEEFRTSGLKQPEFAKSKGIKLGTLQGWLYSRARGGREDVATAPAGRFIEVAPAARTAALVVRVGPASFEVAELPPPAWVAELVTALAPR